ncbi:hypothetical protein G6F59_014434 [Rhizopus arrhizus]|nr:hypothetical protein G6F59_014434 [Rhizopus arrhizus]
MEHHVVAGVVEGAPAQCVAGRMQALAAPARTHLAGGVDQAGMQRRQQRCRQHVRAVPGMGQQPLRHVAGAGIDASGRRDAVVGRLRRQRYPAVAAAHVRTRPARAGLDAGQAEAGIVHAQRLEDAAFDRLFVEAARGGIDHVADQAEGHVLVRVAVARQALQAGVGQLLGQRVVLGVAFDVAVVGVVGQADAMAEHVGDGQAVGGLR